MLIYLLICYLFSHFWYFLKNELESLAPRLGEEEELASQRRIITNLGEIANAVTESLAQLTYSIISSLFFTWLYFLVKFLNASEPKNPFPATDCPANASSQFPPKYFFLVRLVGIYFLQS